MIAIDGKTLRGSYNREDRASTIHMICAYASSNKLVLGQLKTEQKSNEITAIPELIKMLDIKGALVTIDVMACQTKIAKVMDVSNHVNVIYLVVTSLKVTSVVGLN